MFSSRAGALAPKRRVFEPRITVAPSWCGVRSLKPWWQLPDNQPQPRCRLSLICQKRGNCAKPHADAKLIKTPRTCSADIHVRLAGRDFLRKEPFQKMCHKETQQLQKTCMQNGFGVLFSLWFRNRRFESYARPLFIGKIEIAWSRNKGNGLTFDVFNVTVFREF